MNVSTRRPRPVAETVAALRRHVSLLRRYTNEPSAGNTEFLGEIAGKLRLLVIDKRDQKALLTRLARLTGDMDALTYVADVPPGFFPDVEPGDVVELKRWLEFNAVSVGTPHGVLRMTNKMFISVWAQQHGAAHEDWSWAEAFAASMSPSFPQEALDLLIRMFDGHTPNERRLLSQARLVLHFADKYLARLTDENIAAAEVELQRRRAAS